MNNITESTPKQWHVVQWPLLAWVETGLKAMALIIGIIVLVETLAAGNFAMPGGLSLVQLIVQIILALGLVAAIFDRLLEHEIISMVFVIFNNLAHWGIALALISTSRPEFMLVIFFSLMLLGDLVKLAFIKVHNFTVRDTAPAVLYGLTLVYVIGYAIILVLQLLQ